MIYQNSEIKGRGEKPLPPGGPGPRVHGCEPGNMRPAKTPEPEPELKIDLERLVWDPEYRDHVRRRLKHLG